MSKKRIAVYGVEVNTEKNYSGTFLRIFKSEKKADKYYDKKNIEFEEKYSAGIIDLWNLNYETVEI